MNMDLEAWSACLRVLADPTRVRLLALLEREELTVAELSAVTRLLRGQVHLLERGKDGELRMREKHVFLANNDIPMPNLTFII